MKKIFLILIIIILTGCNLGNTPTSKVENLLTNYQMLDKNILVSYTDLTTDTIVDQNTINRYEKAIKTQYRNLSYEIKDEQIDGNQATVTLQIEVANYKKAINKYDKNKYELIEYHNLILKEIENTKEMITYTLEITLTKQDNNQWTINNITEENKNKLLGIY